MSVVCVGLLLWSLGSLSVGAQPAPPQNIMMVTLNTNYTVSWDWDQSWDQNWDREQSGAATFTTQYVAKYKLKSKKKKSLTWSTACENTPRRSCDLTALDLHYLGIYVLRVRAEANGNHSDWVHKEFCPDQDAAIGPPTRVGLSVSGSVVDVLISAPRSSNNSSMKEHVLTLSYRIVYWDRRTAHTQTLNSSVTVVTLPDTKAWTCYCVSVQSRYDYYNKSSSFTSPTCIETEGEIPWWQIVVYFLVSLVVCFLIILLSVVCSFWLYRNLKETLYPSIQMPPHFNQYLCESLGSHIPHLLTPDSQSELLCDQVTVCPGPPLLEVHSPPLDALPEPYSRHNRQDSGGSTDSGVHSAGGSSLGQPHSYQPSSGATASWKGPYDPEQLKMRDVDLGIKSPLVITDEGVVDMCV